MVRFKLLTKNKEVNFQNIYIQTIWVGLLVNLTLYFLLRLKKYASKSIVKLFKD